MPCSFSCIGADIDWAFTALLCLKLSKWFFTSRNPPHATSTEDLQSMQYALCGSSLSSRNHSLQSGSSLQLGLYLTLVFCFCFCFLRGGDAMLSQMFPNVFPAPSTRCNSNEWSYWLRQDGGPIRIAVSNAGCQCSLSQQFIVYKLSLWHEINVGEWGKCLKACSRRFSIQYSVLLSIQA